MLVNGRRHAQAFVAPARAAKATWELLLDTSRPGECGEAVRGMYDLPAWSLALFKLTHGLPMPASPG